MCDMIKKSLMLVVVSLLGSAALVAVPQAAQAAQTSGRVIPLSVSVVGDQVTFHYQFYAIGYQPEMGASTFYSSVELRGCNTGGTPDRDIVARTFETRTGTYEVSITAKASELGSSWIESSALYEDFKDSWSATKTNADSRLQFTCGVPNTTSLSIKYADPLTPPTDEPPVINPPTDPPPATPTVHVTTWSAKKGSTKIGKKAYVTTTTAQAGATVRYTWFVGGKVKDRDRSLKISKKWKGKSVKVKIVVSKSGYKSVSKTISYSKVHK